MQELREVLSDQVTKLQNDETTAGKANAVTNAIGKILSSIKLEMEYQKAMGKTKALRFLEYKEEEK